MDIEQNLPRAPIGTALSFAALAFPFASYVVQEVLLLLTDIHLRAGDAAIHLLWTSAVGVIGLLLASSSIYDASKKKRTLPLRKAIAVGICLSLVVATFELWTHESDRFCGGTAGDCGQWQ